jgi:hypothetical protein
MEGRLNRRMTGVLKARLPDAELHRVDDPRRQQGQRWALATILGAVEIAMLAGCKSLAEMEALTAEASQAARQALGLKGRLPDTTARDVLVRVEPRSLRCALHRQIRRAHRRKQLQPFGLPFGVLTMDGKMTAVKATVGPYVQRKTGSNGPDYGLIRTVTASLISSVAKVCIDASPIPPWDNEQGHYPQALEELLDAYGPLGLFELVDYDAGGCSRTNARYTRECGLHYSMRVKEGSQPTLYADMQRKLGGLCIDDADGVVVEWVKGKRVRRSAYLTDDVEVWPHWTGLRLAVRISYEVLGPNGQAMETEERFYASSLDKGVLSGEQWIAITRGHWAVENNCHQTWDAVFEEDDRPWIVSAPQGTVVMLLLRRMAYNILTLFRSRTLRSAKNRKTPWRDLIRWFYNALVSATEEQLAGMRVRQLPPLLLA